MGVFGYYATGKSRLFEQFALYGKKAIDTDQILIVQVRRIPRSQKAGYTTTPVMRVVFSELLRALRIVVRRPFSDWREMLDAQPTRVTYDDNQFDDIYDKVLLGIEKKTIRLIIIDQIVTSQHLDIYLFEELLKLWRESHGQFSTILGIQMEENANFYKEDLGTDDRRGRVLSWAVVERVFARLSHMGKLW